jgi:hypothetical protein
MKHRLLRFACALFAFACSSYAAPIALSLTGSLSTSESVFEATFTLTGLSSLRFQTWSFGGGTNAGGTAIAPGGFDLLIALFQGAGDSAMIVSQSGNPLADADTLNPFQGNCPPAGTVTIGAGTGSSVCGDDLMIASNLLPGIYTLVLTDANYIPLAVDPGPPSATTLSDGFTDFSGGVFQTCNVPSGGLACISPGNQFAVDIVSLTGPPPTLVPEPATLITSLIGAFFIFRRTYESTKELCVCSGGLGRSHAHLGDSIS